MLVGWDFPLSGQVKLNTDGASTGNQGLAGGGGVIQDNARSQLEGFVMNISWYSSIVAEFQALPQGLHPFWDGNGSIKRVIMEIDSMIIIQFLEKGMETKHPCCPIYYQYKNLIVKDQVVRFKHSYMEENRPVDCLANMAFNVQLGTHCFSGPPTSVLGILLKHISGASLS